MKKKILGIALVAISMVSFSALAQNQTTNNGNEQQTEQVKVKKQKGYKYKSDNKRDKATFNPFEGITLTESQQTQLNALNENRKAARKQKAEARKIEKQAADSVRKAEKQIARNARQQDKKEYLEQIKAIVGPDNYVIYLENMVVNAQPQRSNKGKGMKLSKPEMRKGNHAKMQNRGNGKPRADRDSKTANV